MCRAINLEAAANGEQQQQVPASSITIHAYPRDWRRRSADVGGLQLALAAAADDINDSAADWDQDQSTLGAQGQGWMGGDPGDVETVYAELLSDMYTQTMNSVNDNSLDSLPPTISNSKRTKLIWALDRWHFEPHLLEEEEVLACTLLLFEALYRVEGMQGTIPISMQQITAFIHHLRRIYRLENSYHTFEHALDVLQATQSYLKSAGIVPPPSFLLEPPERRWSMKKKFNCGSLIATLGLRELFVLYVAAIGHDVGHPGFNNHFIKNAQAPLSLIYPGSALEQMHVQLLLRVMRAHGLGVLLDDPAHGAHLRKVLVQSVLATDMGVHDQFMETLRTVVEGGKGTLCMRQVVMCQAILKNADISNPTRPFLISKHWAKALSLEWSAQAALESSYHLQPTVTPFTASPLQEASSQIFFISRYARPLLELTERAVPEMRMYVTHCRKNLREWVTRKRGLEKEEVERAGLERERGRGRQKEGSEEGAESVVSVPSTPGMAAVIPVALQTALTTAAGTGTTPTPTPLPSATPLAPPGSPRQIQGYHSAFPLTLPTHQPLLPLSFGSTTAYSSASSSCSSSSSSCPSEKAHSLTRTHSRMHVNVHDDGSSSSSASASGSRAGSGSGSAGTQSIPPASPSLSASASVSASDEADSAAAFSPVSEISSLSALGPAPDEVQVHVNVSLRRFPSISSNASHGIGGGSVNGSVNGSINGSGLLTPTTAGHAKTPAHTAAIRAASKAGSMRKKSQKNLCFGFGFGAFGGGHGDGEGGEVGVGGGGRKAARNSWCASSSAGASLAALFQAQAQVQVVPGANGYASAKGMAGSKEKEENDEQSLPPPPASAPPNVGANTNGVKPMRPSKLQVSP